MSDFTQEKYEEFVGLYQDPNDGHNTLMGIGQQMMTNTDLARRLRVNFKSADGAAAGQGSGDGDDGSQIDMEFFLTAMHDEIQKDPALAGRLGLVSSKEQLKVGSANDGQLNRSGAAGDSGSSDDGDDSPVAVVVPHDEGDEESGESGEGAPEPQVVTGFKQKAAALIDEVFGRKEVGDMGSQLGYDDYEEEPFEDELTLSASDVGDGVGVEDQYGSGAFDDGDFEVGEKGANNLQELTAIVSREAAKAAGGAASRQVAKQMAEQMGSLQELVGALVARLEGMDKANEAMAAATDEQMSAVKEAVQGLRSQYELLDEQLPAMANFDRLRVDKGFPEWGVKSDGGVDGGAGGGEGDGDGYYDDYDYENTKDGSFVDPLVQEVFGVANSW